jgi:hypothetical protein
MRKFCETENNLKPYFLAHELTNQSSFIVPFLMKLMVMATSSAKHAITVRQSTSE